jgi:hypothetical protein
VLKIEKERDEYEQNHEKLKKWNSAHKNINSETPMFQITDDDFLTFDEGPPKHRWNGKVPCIVVYFDDIIGSQLLLGKGQREVGRLCLFHRHIGGFTDPKMPGADGCSMLFNVQSWKISVGGLPKALRNNLTLMILFKTTSTKEMWDIAESVEGEISTEKFLAVCKSAWKDDHDFLLIDLHPKKNHPSMFRRNFETFLIP